ncbi:F0F1 ATP synthase subunit epsilon [Neptunomonas antarctica]|uniref:ATP synthase epsilon chain n=1 Tax=Neptunomonas antarctica TaxID=619304 RepID=A0A1N7M587_9GAMM|nr:F0F1 ATP synthase subunit epsilon [Neptunomonas antarctica]SIS81203.1 F-type H+-transporting ATPase subunit epsilon [Neptunomonas antarctica]
MAVASINLKVLLPSQLFIEQTGILHMVVETCDGAFGFLPHRLDCVAALVPGILSYETAAGGEVFIAVDEGVLVKTGFDVIVSVHRAVIGKELSALHDLIQQEFLTLDEEEKSLRSTMVKLETGFLRRVAGVDHE